MEDTTVTCIECLETFVHSVIDQEFYQKKGWGDLIPKRCGKCRKTKKAAIKEKAATQRKRDEAQKKRNHVRAIKAGTEPGETTSKNAAPKAKPKAAAGGGLHSQKVGPIPADMVKVVIGKGGDTINKILADTQARVRVDTDTCMVTVDGKTAEIVLAGVAAIHAVQAHELQERQAALDRREANLKAKEEKLARDEKRAKNGKKRKAPESDPVEDVQDEGKEAKRVKKKKWQKGDKEGDQEAVGTGSPSPKVEGKSPKIQGKKRAGKAEDPEASKEKARQFREAKKKKSKPPGDKKPNPKKAKLSGGKAGKPARAAKISDGLS